MKKIVIVIMLVMTFLGSVAYGASSEEVYVRKDVNEVEKKSMEKTMEQILSKLSVLEEKLNGLSKEVAVSRSDQEGYYRTLDKRIEDLRGDIYLGLVLLGMLLGIPSITKLIDWLLGKTKKRVEELTQEELQRIREMLKMGDLGLQVK